MTARQDDLSHNRPAPHLLVVDDTQSIRQHLAQLLRDRCQAQVTEAENGLQAIKHLKEQAFALVVTDVNMPFVDGLKLTTLVRQDATHKNVPILIMTTEASDENRQRALAMGATDYVKKPAADADVVALVLQLLDQPRGHGRPRSS